MRKLHELPKFSDRWSYLYLEHGRLDQDGGSLIFHDLVGRQSTPLMIAYRATVGRDRDERILGFRLRA